MESLVKARFRGGRVLAAVSGGKDSVAMLDILAWASEKLGFEVIGVHVNLGIPGYSEHAASVAVEACRTVGVPCIVADARLVLGFDTGCAAKGVAAGIEKRPVCSLCGIVKRRVLEEYASILEVDAIATGHTLSDVIGFAIANLTSKVERRFGVVEEGVFTRLKPLARVTEADTLSYVIARRLPFTETPCPYKPSESTVDKVKTELLRVTLYQPKLLERLSVFSYHARLPKIKGRCIYCGAPSEQDYCTSCKLRSRLARVCNG